jgi:hypothetical protein
MITARIDWPTQPQGPQPVQKPVQKPKQRRGRRGMHGVDPGIGSFSWRGLLSKIATPVLTGAGSLVGAPEVGAAAGLAITGAANAKKDKGGASAGAPAGAAAKPAEDAAAALAAAPKPEKTSKLPLILAGAGGVTALVVVGLIVYLAARKSGGAAPVAPAPAPRRRARA